MRLIPPDHLRGSMNGQRFWIKDRDRWVLDALEHGHPEEAIAEVLHLDPATIGVIRRRHGVLIRRVNPRRPNTGKLNVAVDAMPETTRAALFRIARRTGKPLADVLVEFFTRSHEARKA